MAGKKITDEQVWRIKHYFEYLEKYKFKYFGEQLWQRVKKDELPEPKIKRIKK